MRSVVDKLLRWFYANARDLPWRRTLDPYAVWVSEIMLQQTQVSTVIPYWERWMRELPDINSLACAPEQKVLKLWEGLGYYTRARNLRRAAQALDRNDFPRDYEQILDLPGIGRYTAGAICSIAFNQPRPVLDGNVRRVLSRLLGANDGLWEAAERFVSTAARMRTPPRQPRVAKIKLSGPCGALNQALMELGATICTPRQPDCEACPVSAICAARKLGEPELFPVRATRPEVTRRYFAVFIHEKNGRFLVQQRPNGVINARLWEFPNTELPAKPHPPGLRLCAFQHTITRYRITVEAFLVHGKPPATGKWLPLARLEALPFSSAHRKILVALRTQNAV